MKSLYVRCGDVVLFDGEVDEVSWTDGPSGVSVAGKIRKPASGGGSNFLDLLSAAASKKRPVEQGEEVVAEVVDQQA